MPFEGQTNPWSLICPCRWKSWPQRKAVTVAPGCWRSRSLSIYSDFSPWILLRRQLGCQSWQGSQTVRWSAQRSFFWRRRSAPISAQCHMIPYEFCICCDLIPSEFATSSGQMLAWFRAWHIEVGGGPRPSCFCHSLSFFFVFCGMFKTFFMLRLLIHHPTLSISSIGHLN